MAQDNTYQLNIIKSQPSLVYKLAFKNNLSLSGAEEEKPQFLGTLKEFKAFDEDLDKYGLSL